LTADDELDLNFYKEESMSRHDKSRQKMRQKMIVVALGTLALAGLPFAPASAQTGDALANAEQTCLDNGVGPHTAMFDSCVRRTADAYNQGQPELALRQAGMIRNANDVCRSYGIAPETLGYKQCVGNELQKSMVASNDTRYARSYDVPSSEAPHATARVDAWGFRYDSAGNLLDQNGYVIRAVPR